MQVEDYKLHAMVIMSVLITVGIIALLYAIFNPPQVKSSGVRSLIALGGFIVLFIGVLIPSSMEQLKGY